MAVSDLSALVPSINGGASMAASNTISDTPEFAPAGSVSEQTADLPYAPVHNAPGPDLGTVTDHAHFVQAPDDVFAGHTWDAAYSSVDSRA